MQIFRTIMWVLLTILVTSFVILNWGDPQPVKIWPGDAGDSLLFEWPVGFIAIIFFAAGFLPMWLFHRGAKWRLSRRIGTLENALRSASKSPSQVSEATPAPTPLTPETTKPDDQ